MTAFPLVKGTRRAAAGFRLRDGWRAAAAAWERREDRRIDAVIAAREANAARELRLELTYRWKAGCERLRLGLAQHVSSASTHAPGAAPICHEVVLGPPTRLMVELRPGQVLQDLQDSGEALAGAMLCHKLTFELQGRGPFVIVSLIADDPHADVIHEVDGVNGSLTLGPDENGVPVRFSMSSLPMWAVQSTTGFGKTTLLYSIMSQLVAMPGVKLVGIDGSGIIFRPMVPDPWRVSGLADPYRAVDVLDELVAEMDYRCGRMPRDDDKLPCGPGHPDPWLVVVVEELPGLLVALDAADPKLGKRARALLARLHAEGRKTGLRLISVAQRYDANSTAGAIVRNNCALRVSFAVENRAACEMLHEGASLDVVAEHLHAVPGVALVSAPGAPLRRVRFPLVSYQDWVAAAMRVCNRA